MPAIPQGLQRGDLPWVDVALPPYLQGLVLSGVRDYSAPVFSPMDYGAVGDGTTDDTAAVNAASTAARAGSGYLILPADYVFGINGLILVKNGSKGIVGEGGWLKFLTGAGLSGIHLAGIDAGESANVSKALISGVKIDCNGIADQIGIDGQSAQNCVITNNIIRNFDGAGFGIVVRAMSVSSVPPKGNAIVGNRISGTSSTNQSIGVFGAFDFGVHGTDVKAKWLADFDLGSNFVFATDNLVAENDVSGGGYGIGLNAAHRCAVYRNRVTKNSRNISVQTRSCGNSIYENVLSETTSSSIHLAYESCDNTIDRNVISTTVGVGEGLLQSYIGSKRNAFRKNSVNCSSVSGSKYQIYCAVKSDDCLFVDNSLVGTASRAYIAIESAWDSAITNPAHRNYGAGTSDDDFTDADMSGVVLRRNSVSGTSAVPAIFLSQINDANGSWKLTKGVLDENVLIGTAYSNQIEIFEITSGNLSAHEATNNNFETIASSASALPRGFAHFSTNSGNTWALFGQNLIANSDFSTGTGWYNSGATPGWAISGGVAECTGTASGNRWLVESSLVLTPGLTYQVAGDFVVSAGNVGLDIGGAAASTAVTGSFTWSQVPSITYFQAYGDSAFIGSVDNLTIRRAY